MAGGCGSRCFPATPPGIQAQFADEDKEEQLVPMASPQPLKLDMVGPGLRPDLRLKECLQVPLTQGNGVSPDAPHRISE